MTTKTVQTQAVAAIQMVSALAEAIRSVERIPSGHLYAQVMGSMSLENYQQAIGFLKRAGLVTETAHMLTWSGPTFTG